MNHNKYKRPTTWSTLLLITNIIVSYAIKKVMFTKCLPLMTKYRALRLLKSLYAHTSKWKVVTTHPQNYTFTVFTDTRKHAMDLKYNLQTIIDGKSNTEVFCKIP